MTGDIGEMYDKIYRYCYFRLHSRDRAEDITQETFLRYLRHYGGRPDIRYLYTIAKNLCADSCRRPHHLPLDREIPEEAEDKLIARIAVNTALSRLDPGRREILMLRYGSDTPVKALREIYKISRFAVYRRLKNAEREFRTLLQEENDEKLEK